MLNVLKLLNGPAVLVKTIQNNLDINVYSQRIVIGSPVVATELIQSELISFTSQ